MKTLDSYAPYNECLFIRAKQQWRGLYQATYRFRGSNRHYTKLFYLCGGVWQSGSENQFTRRSEPVQIAPQAIQDGLNNYVKSQAPIVHNGR